MSNSQLLQDCITCLKWFGFDVIDNSKNDPTYPWVIKKNTRGEYSAGTSFTTTDLIYKVCKQLSKEEEVMNKLLGWEYNTSGPMRNCWKWEQEGELDGKKFYHKVYPYRFTIPLTQSWLRNKSKPVIGAGVVMLSLEAGIRWSQLCSLSIYESFREGFTG